MKGIRVMLFLLACPIWGLYAQIDEWERLQRNIQLLKGMEAELMGMQAGYRDLETSYERIIALFREERRIREREEWEEFQVDPSWAANPLMQTMGQRILFLQDQLRSHPNHPGLSRAERLRQEAWKGKMKEALDREKEWGNLLLRPGALRMDPVRRWTELLLWAERVKALDSEYRRFREHQIWRQHMRRKEEEIPDAYRFFYDSRNQD